VTDLLDHHDVLLADLDGTLYRGRDAVPGAVDAVLGAAGRGVRTVYITNNASRRPADVAEHLAELGFPAGPDDVVASSQAAAAMLAEQLPAGASVLVVGTDALVAEVTAVGLAVTDVATGRPRWCRATARTPGGGSWPRRRSRCGRVRCGWRATWMRRCRPNVGRCRGNGSMVAALRAATGREPQVAGKPAPALLVDAVRRTGARAALMIGDRLDTDVEGGRAAGLATLLVLTGVSDATELLAAPAALRPDYVDADLGALTRDPHDLAPGPRPGWDATVTGPGELTLAGAGGDDLEDLDALRALCAAHWEAGGGPVRVTARGPGAERVLATLGLGGDAACSATVAGAGTTGRTATASTDLPRGAGTAHIDTAGAHR
jgi:Predicted sugar phosphatases of the HAD superfamily